jgi:hypothetical protein
MELLSTNFEKILGYKEEWAFFASKKTNPCADEYFMENNTAFLIMFLLVLSGCNPLSGGEKTSKFGGRFSPGMPFKNATEDGGGSDNPPSQVSVGGFTGFKTAPGIVRFTGSGGSGKSTITPSDRIMRGSNISGRFSINKDQVR